jgi:hypothetical protein
VATTAFIAGFFTALGFWTAGKLTDVVDNTIKEKEPPAIVQQTNPTKKEDTENVK